MSDLMERGRANAAEVTRRLRPLIESRPAREQGLLIALLERGAGARYRRWAEDAAGASERAGLEACADREEQIAAAVEALADDAAAVQASLRSLGDELRAVFDAGYGGRPRDEQLATQAAAERVGAGVWRDFAAEEANAATRATYERCAKLEEESADYLDALLAGR